jgi:uncharacterized protein
MSERALNDPQVSAETEAFWEATREERFLIKHCRACDRAHWYPRTYCPFCSSAETEWRDASGAGVIYSYSVMRRSDPIYVMAYVTLEEGPTMMTNLVDCDPDNLSVGSKVRLTFKPTPGGFALPMFTPLEDLIND